MATIDLSDEQLQEVVSVAILQAIDKTQRDNLIKEAIRGLLAPKEEPGGYGRTGPTPIQEAFNHAVSGVAHQVAREMLENDPETKEKIRSLLNDVLQRVFDHEREQMTHAMVNAFITALSS